ncbi:response regulator [Flaviaesturariibacter aridisoli]|uniref:Response regulator transcription factor n=1 Tax=Flaviaesturariibacter aridisoli TaxID=2545761 RepID=A0A4R4E6L8_9BACT|nr:response regulator transcription factor [Flaviaesturariibacter aridisoli]TCZ73348.1 response regulator transcription factor [Flaviaesturariibacter aridisoli]
MNRERTTIVLVDDHELLLDGISSILEDRPQVSVLGKATSAEEALPLIARLQPDLVLTDISMGQQSGLWLTKTLGERFPLIRVIVLSMHESTQHISSLLEAGARGYLLKNVKPEELLTAIDRVMKGEQYLQRSIEVAYQRSVRQQQAAGAESRLTPREVEIIRLIVQGLSTPEISKTLFISEFTVETHRKNIGRKTGARTPLTLIKYAQQNGMV